MTDIPRLEAVKEAPDTTHRHTVGESMASSPIHNCAGPRARARSLVRKNAFRARSVIATAAIWLESCANAYAAVALYANLSRLSDAELQRRGLARDTLARDLLENTRARAGTNRKQGASR